VRLIFVDMCIEGTWGGGSDVEAIESQGRSCLILPIIMSHALTPPPTHSTVTYFLLPNDLGIRSLSPPMTSLLTDYLLIN
jgi:hypothetical protein